MSSSRVLRPKASIQRLIFGLRPEEAIAGLFLVPTTWLTWVAHSFSVESGDLGPRFAGGMLRIGVAVVCAAILYLASRRPAERGSPLFMVREMLPFLLCILIYTNLHDTIGFVNPNDIHQSLLAIDVWLFGVEPSLWAEQFYSRELTEIFQIFYMSFAVLAPVVPLVLLVRKRFEDFRRAAFSIILCFYLGYALYLIFPATPPRIALAGEFRKNLGGYPFFASAAAENALALLPTDSRAAFPSLHAAVSLLALVLAWRFTRGLFFVLVPMALGLWVSTIYLRHHFVIDLFAGFLLAPLAYALSPRLDAWWSGQRTLSASAAPGLTPERARASPEEPAAD